MKSEQSRPSIKRIVWTDYTAFFFSSLPIAFWVVVLAWVPNWRGTGAVASAGAVPLLVMAAALTTVIAVLVVVWRVSWFWSIFRTGKIVPAKVAYVNFRRDRGRVEYVYAIQNKSFQSHSILHRNQQTRSLRPGERVTLLVDPRHPERAFIRDLYV